jgi:hypothetical protein
MSKTRDLLILGAIAAAVGIGALTTSGKPSAQPPAAPKAWSASAGSFTGCTAAKRAVQERLKAAASAKFAGCSSRPVNASTVTAFVEVDSQNGFGAMLRSNFLVTVIEGTVTAVQQVTR